MIGGRKCAQRFKGGGSLERLERQVDDGGGWTNQTAASLPEHAVGWRLPISHADRGTARLPSGAPTPWSGKSRAGGTIPPLDARRAPEHVYGEAGARRPARWISVRSVSKQTESLAVSKS
jgi:hypothetical protein